MNEVYETAGLLSYQRVSPDVEWAAQSGRISEAFPFVLSKPPVKLGREETISAILGLKTNDLPQASEINNKVRHYT